MPLPLIIPWGLAAIGAGAVANQYINKPDGPAVVVNTSAPPVLGRIGMAGGVLALTAGAYLIYRQKKRGRR